ncbi:MAG: asparagine synthetase A [Thermoplasmatota archaeon]
MKQFLLKVNKVRDKMKSGEYERYKEESLKKAIKVKSKIRQAMGNYLRKQGFTEISPVIISPETDPLYHATGKAGFEYYNGKYQLTRSMILHKQISLLSLDKIFVFSPNVRLEPIELADTGKHLVEFSQLDLEVKGASREDVLDLGEGLLVDVLSKIKKECKEELEYFDRDLKMPDTPFERIKYHHAYNKYGRIFEEVLSQDREKPFWLIDIPSEDREFYDKEDPSRPGILRDMDLIYPEGFGEALSGGEREYEPENIKTRIEEQDLDPEDFAMYLEYANKGLPQSAGFGIGLERLTRYVCGLDDIKDTLLFPKMPGTVKL